MPTNTIDAIGCYESNSIHQQIMPNRNRVTHLFSDINQPKGHPKNTWCHLPKYLPSSQRRRLNISHSLLKPWTLGRWPETGRIWWGGGAPSPREEADGGGRSSARKPAAERTLGGGENRIGQERTAMGEGGRWTYLNLSTGLHEVDLDRSLNRVAGGVAR